MSRRWLSPAFVHVLVLAACGGADRELDTTVGAVGGPCAADGSCSAGAICKGGRCVQKGGGAGSGGGSGLVCGDGVVGAGEECDGANLAGSSCASLLAGYTGSLGCTVGCKFDKSTCKPPGSCGDGKKSGSEECDGTDLGGLSCADAGPGYAGKLACAANCQFDASGCKLALGYPAVSGEECASGLASTASSQAKQPGYCTKKCNTDADCSTGVPMRCSGAGGFCYVTCANDGNCASLYPSWTCKPALDKAQNVVKACGVYTGLSAGSPCSSHGQCASGNCAGFCAQQCGGSLPACPTGTTCMGTTPPYCFPNCSSLPSCEVFGPNFACGSYLTNTGTAADVCAEPPP